MNTKLHKIAEEFDAAPQDASWGPGHPIFEMAVTIDRLHTELSALHQAHEQLADAVKAFLDKAQTPQEAEPEFYALRSAIKVWNKH